MSVENQILQSSVVCCINCGTTIDLNVYANRDDNGKITAYLFACMSCSLALKNAKFGLIQRNRPA